MTSDLTPFLDAVRDRMAKAMPGPWTWNGEGFIAPATKPIDKVRGDNVQFFLLGINGACWDADRTLIAHAPTDLTRLLKLIHLILDGNCENCRTKILEQGSQDS